MRMQKITYAGHAAVLITADEAIIAVDPWLEGNPRCPDAFRNPSRLDLIVLTHGHSDHAGDAVRLAKQYGSQVAAIYELALILGEEGVPQDNLIPMNKGGTVDWRGLRVTLTHALHSSSYDTSRGARYAGEACGAILSDGIHTIYHPGDTALFSDMRLLGEIYHPDVAFMPIGDHFTMGPEDAARAVEFVGCKTVIPMHYATFGILTGTPGRLEEACRKRHLDVKVAALPPGGDFSL